MSHHRTEFLAHDRVEHLMADAARDRLVAGASRGSSEGIRTRTRPGRSIWAPVATLASAARRALFAWVNGRAAAQ